MTRLEGNHVAVTVVLETSFLEHLNNPGWNAIVETIVKPAGFPAVQPKTPPGPETNEIRISNYQKLTVKPTDQG